MIRVLNKANQGNDSKKSRMVEGVITEGVLSLKERSWQVLSRGPSGDRIARSCCHTVPDLTVKTEGER